MIEIFKPNSRKPQHNWQVNKDGEHIGALVTMLDDPKKEWIPFRFARKHLSPEEALVLDEKLSELNSHLDKE